MKKLVEFPLEDGTCLTVEVDEPDSPDSLVRASRDNELIVHAQQSFESAIDRVKPAASIIIQKLRSLHDSPDEIDVEFGLKLTATAGAVVAAAGLEANYKVTLKWQKTDLEKNKPEAKANA
jgi:hypothetical protein